jgi:hypothetical protein
LGVAGIGSAAGAVVVGDVGDSWAIPSTSGDSGLVKMRLEQGVTSALVGFELFVEALEVVGALEAVADEELLVTTTPGPLAG